MAKSNEMGRQWEMDSEDDSKNRGRCLFSLSFTSSSLSLQSVMISFGLFWSVCGPLWSVVSIVVIGHTGKRYRRKTKIDTNISQGKSYQFTNF